MALARAFTAKRNKRPEISLPATEPQRSFSTRHANAGGKSFQRTQISAPVELLSTTNMLSFNAPDLPGHNNNNNSSLKIGALSSSASSSGSASGDESDAAVRTFFSSPATSVENSPIDSRPTSPNMLLEHNHLSEYFAAAAASTGNTLGRSASTASAKRFNNDEGMTMSTPVLPQRVPSHTKASHKALARKRSLQRMSPPNALQTASSTAEPVSQEPVVPQSHNTAVQSSLAMTHPFGKELEQVDELAEEYGVADSMLDEEEMILRRKGLQKFGAGDYADEIAGLLGGVFEDSWGVAANSWI